MMLFNSIMSLKLCHALTENTTTVVISFGKLNKPLLKLFLCGMGVAERYFPMDQNTTKCFEAGILLLVFAVSCHQDAAL